jgi:NitT/TauT family transport system ATP-binding protein
VWSLLHDEVRRAQEAGHAKIQPDGTAPDETRTITTGKAA